MTLTSSTVLTEPLSAVKQGLLLSEMASASSAIADNKNVFYVDTSIPPILDDGPFRFWHEKRMIRCIFCINYDDYNNLSTFGCELGEHRVQTCLGNFCYMRQHKRPEYFLYTSGCINLTSNGMAAIRNNIAVSLTSEAEEENLELNRKKRLRLLNKKQKYQKQQQNLLKNDKKNGKTTQLCEVGQNVNTCICTNRHLCNNVSVVEPYIEFSDNIFTGIDFDELAHFRFLLPNDPILKEFKNQRKNVLGGINRVGGNYLLVKDDINKSFKNNFDILYFFIIYYFLNIVILRLFY
uniref:Uncharacterized protein n=1 Tax=Meloidogyne enterolobii TaxID=390850 RepID=A0A6V7UHI1_MELEN|nr:unnamed protein product [Meloidogyne enterolobii]